jgi:cytochrome oxidase assembly protein ShyY1
MFRLRVRPKIAPVPALAALAMVALTVSLGNWQSGRALEKDVIETRHAGTRDAAELAVGQGQVTAEDVDGRRVIVRGEYLAGRTVYWDNQIVNRTPGFAVVSALRLAGGEQVVLIDRGLLPASGADRSRLPVLPAAAGEVTIHGRAYLAPKRTLELNDHADQGSLQGSSQVVLWQNLNPAKFAAATGLKVHGFILRESGPAPAGLLRAADNSARDTAPAESGMTAAKHRGYAFQWYSLAALTALLFLLFTFMTNDDPARDA